MTPLYLALFAAALALTAVGWWFLKGDPIDRETIRRHAEARGWTMRETAEGGREILLLSPANAAWSLEISRNLSRSRHVTTSYLSQTPVLESGILAVRAGPPLPSGASGFGNNFVQTILRRAIVEMCGEPGALPELFMVPGGEPVFDATHTVIVTDPTYGKQWVDEGLRAALLAWPKGMEVPDLVFWQQGIRLGIVGRITQIPATLDALVEKGESLRQLLNR